MANAEKLEEFVRASLMKGHQSEWIRAQLKSGGWMDHQIDAALYAFDGFAEGLPLPSARAKHRPNAWFLEDTDALAKQVFSVVESLVVLAAVGYAAARTGATSLVVLYFSLWLLLVMQLVGSWTKLEWYIWPSFDRSDMKNPRTIFRALGSLFATYLLYVLVDDIVNQLLKMQAAS